MSILKILLEAIEEDYLYHYTNAGGVMGILDSNVLFSKGSWSVSALGVSRDEKWSEGVSFTRDKNLIVDLPHYTSKGSYVLFGIVFNRKKLKSNYKLHPFDVYGYSMKELPRDQRHDDQKKLQEEIILDQIDNVKRYIEHVYLNMLYVERNNIDTNRVLEELIRVVDACKQDNVSVKYGYGHQTKELDMDYPKDEKYSDIKYFFYKQLFE